MENNFNIFYIALLVGTIGDLLIPFIIAPFYKGYNHLKMVMSLLGNSNFNYHYIYNIWLIIAGCFIFIGGFKLYFDVLHISNVLSLILFIFISIFAVGACILSGIFSVEESKDLSSLSSKIHGFGSVFGFLSLLFTPLVLGLLSFKDSNLINGFVFIFCFILAFIFFVLFIMSDKPKFKSSIISYEGLWQRLSLLFMYFPIIIFSFEKIFD